MLWKIRAQRVWDPGPRLELSIPTPGLCDPYSLTPLLRALLILTEPSALPHPMAMSLTGYGPYLWADGWARTWASCLWHRRKPWAHRPVTGEGEHFTSPWFLLSTQKSEKRRCAELMGQPHLWKGKRTPVRYVSELGQIWPHYNSLGLQREVVLTRLKLRISVYQKAPSAKWKDKASTGRRYF